jgi:hypothetical protein
MEPSDQTFARSYRFLDAHGENLDLGTSIGGRSYYSRASESEAPGSPSASYKPSRFYDRPHYDRTKQISNMSVMSRWSDNTLVQSVLLADGLIATDNEEELFEELPARYQKGDVKSTLTWFGALCLGGIGMFVEAYVIITTGQVKTVWHDNYPTCWDAQNDQTCPNLIQCCNLFPNTPQDLCSNGNIPSSSLCTGDDYDYPESLTCSTQQLGGVSYAEFAGIMFGMLSFGAIIDIIGRKKAGSLTSTLMILGVGGMTYIPTHRHYSWCFRYSLQFLDGVSGASIHFQQPMPPSIMPKVPKMLCGMMPNGAINEYLWNAQRRHVEEKRYRWCLPCKVSGPWSDQCFCHLSFTFRIKAGPIVPGPQATRKE